MNAFDTTFPADSVEFCPHPRAQDIFVCGTYNLVQSDKGEAARTQPQRRHGQCLVFKCLYDEEHVDQGSFDKIQGIDLPAILDMKWCHTSNTGAACLGIADSEGNISLHQWNEDEALLELKDNIQVASSAEILCLSLDWSNRRYPGDRPGRLIVSLSDGSLALLDSRGSSLVVTESWHAHDYEPWIAAWNYWDTHVVYSGGDDLTLKGWDTRVGFMQPVFVNKRFDAGVTTIQCHPHIENLIAVGSYDSTVRLYDLRKPLVPITQVDVSGGAWRVKWHPSATRRHDLLVACMHSGFKVIRFDLDTSKPIGDIVKKFDKHESLAYGVDWSFAERGEKTAIASCSFYDHQLHLWSA